jgi:MFS family permease
MALAPSKLSGGVAFKYPDFVNLQTGRWFVVCALEMQTVAIGWQVFAITGSTLALGLVNLFQFGPIFLLFLAAGHASDVIDRRKLLGVCYAALAVCSALLILFSIHGLQSVGPIYEVAVLLGIVRAFYGPAGRSILPALVPAEHFPNAVAWAGMILQSANVLGPSLGGLVYAASHGPIVVYVASCVSSTIATIAVFRIKADTHIRSGPDPGLRRVLAGLGYIWEKKLLLGAISLDLFAVLLGGATALLPAYAVLLKTGPWGLGLLRSAPGIGGVLMAILVAYKPVERRAGATMLWCVAGFGLFTIAFGISRSLIVSLLSLVFVGAADMVSVIVRATLVQTATPNDMRGRVSAVEMIFIGASNELGGFESGLTAHYFGTIPSVVIGGVGTLLVTGIWACSFPALRQVETLTGDPD